jgi:preprotein translocase subunit Sec61beta
MGLDSPAAASTPGRGPRAAAWAALAMIFLWAAAGLVYPPITKYDLYDPGLGGREGDVGQYVRIYQGVPLLEIARPFRYRVLTPWMARLVPPVPHGLLRYFDVSEEKLVKYHFGIVNMVALAVSGLLMIMLCRSLGFGVRDGVLAAFLYYTSFPVINSGGTPMVDAWAHAFLLLGLVAALRGSHAWLFVASLLGLFAKETTLLIVPAVLLLNAPARSKVTRLLAVLPGVIAYAVFRFVLYPGGYGAPSDPATAMSNLFWRLNHGPYLLWILFDGGIAFGLLWPLAAYGAWSLRGDARSPLLRLAWLVPGILLVPFLIGSNIGRIWFYAFPVVIPLAVAGLDRMLNGCGGRAADRTHAAPAGTSAGLS